MTRKPLCLLTFVLLLASCQREQDWNGAPEIKATVEEGPGTRTSISVNSSGTGTIYWNRSDEIDVFFGTKKATYTSQNSSNATTATFKKSSGSVNASDVSSTNIWGLYPSNSSSTCNGSAITTTLPSTQYGVANTFDDDLFPAIAHSTTTTLQFYNVCGGIKFNMVYADIKKVTFRGNNNENIAGTVSITFTDGVPKATVTSGVKEITLTPKSGISFTKGADYYITLLPGTLSNGFTITFTATDGTVGTLNYTDKSVTIKRSVFSKKGNMDVYAAFGDARQPNNVIYYTSSNGLIITPFKTNDFGANIVTNEYVGGRGVITFDGVVTSIGDYAFSYCYGLTSITIPNSVTRIGFQAFINCTKLTSITIPNSVTIIDDHAFCRCIGLTSITIPNSVTSIGSNPFNNCKGLTSIVVESGNSAYDSRNNCNAIIRTGTNELVSGCKKTVILNSVTEIGISAFEGIGLTTITIPKSVTKINTSAFTNNGLTSITIPNSVSYIGWNPFTDCNDLISIVVESGNPVYDSRNNCNAIIQTDTNTLVSGCKNTIIPNSVTSIGDAAFQSLDQLSSIEIPNSVTKIGFGAFNGCPGLTSVNIPYSVTKIDHYAFYLCPGLTSIIVNPSIPPSLGQEAFDETNNCPIYVPAQSVDAYKSANGWNNYADRLFAIHEAVDMGLPSGLKWATCNVGASSPEGYGDYFAWGETEPKSIYNWSTYEWCNGSRDTMTKYCNNSSYGYNGFTDNKTVLDLEDDAAHVNWGGSWRMPTNAEWTELRNNCTWTWTTQNGVNGYRVTSNKTGYTDKSIFLPAAGDRYDTSLRYVGTYGTYWSSSLFAYTPDCAWLVNFNSSSILRSSYGYRFYGFSVRPVYGDFISVESISLNKSSLSITEGETSQLSATVMPANATEKTVTWTSSNTSVATVSSEGVVTAVSAGAATITAWASDGEHFATCSVTVQAPTTGTENGHDWVDLGLPSGLKWATCNVGASSPNDEGDYFAWGEIETKNTYSWETYKWCKEGVSPVALSKYVTKSGYGTTDYKGSLEPSDDAAYMNWGGNWRTPTSNEISELIENCTWTWTTQDGTDGFLVTSNINGKNLFIPSYKSSPNNCYFGSNTVFYNNPKNAYRLYASSGSAGISVSATGRFLGIPVRPVTN